MKKEMLEFLHDRGLKIWAPSEELLSAILEEAERLKANEDQNRVKKIIISYSVPPLIKEEND